MLFAWRAPSVRFAAALLLSLWTLAAVAAPAALSRHDWIVGLSEAWYTARLFHPKAAADVDAWDASFIKLIERTPDSPAQERMRALVEEWLASLDDPWTYLHGRDLVDGLATDPIVQRTENRVHVKLGDVSRAGMGHLKALAEQWKDADEVVFDLRPTTAKRLPALLPASAIDSAGALEHLLARPVVLPQLRTRYHSGYVPEIGLSSGGYESGFRYSAAPLRFQARGTRDVPLRFIVDRHTALPVLAAALQREGRATIESTGSEAPLTAWALPQARFKVGDVSFVIRTGELAWEMNALPQRRDIAPVSEAFPSGAERVFAALKLWWTVRLFFAYPDLADQPWQSGLRPAVAEAESAANVAEYHAALSRLASLSDDGHVGVHSPVVARTRAARPAIAARIIEGKLVVVRVGLPAFLAEARIDPGDIIEAVDGIAVAERLAALRTTRGFSSEANLHAWAPTMLAGSPDTKVNLTIRRADGQAAVIDLPRHTTPSGMPEITTPTFTTLASGLGYVDLTRLEVAAVDEMLHR